MNMYFWNAGCSETTSPDVETQTPETTVKSYDFDYAQNEVAMQEMMNGKQNSGMGNSPYWRLLELGELIFWKVWVFYCGSEE